MRALHCVVLGLVCAVVAVGCNRGAKQDVTTAPGGTSGGGKVGVIDLDAVAKSVGRTGEMEKELVEFRNTLSKQLDTQLAEFNKQLKDRKDVMGEKPTDEQQKDLVVVAGNLKTKFEGLQQEAGVQLQRHQFELINRFKEDVKDPVREVAKERGISTVLMKNDMLIFLQVDDSADITDAVIAKLKASSAASSEKPAAPKSDDKADAK